MKSVHLSVLASAVGLALASGGIAATATNRNVSLDSASSLSNGSGASSVIAEARDGGSTQSSGRYFITFVEPGLARYNGGVAGLAPTAAHIDGVSANSSNKLQVNSSAAHAYRSYLSQQRAEHIAGIESALGATLKIRFTFDVTRNAVSAELTHAQAAQIARLAQNPNSGIASVAPVEIKQTDTFRGPKFIGADKIWDGTAVPAYDTATRGAGVKVGVIDTGTYVGHPSFANDPMCGFSDAAPKLHPRDCTSTDANGICNGPDANAQAAGDTLYNTHGVHTSSTAAGNTIDNTVTPAPLLPDGLTMSGVAPCASVYAYRVADHTDGKLYGDYLDAALENAIIDQVDVANYSIGPTCGGGNPWSELEFLDMMASDIFVAASAGNTRSTCTNPIGLVANNGPWEMTVAASTQDQIAAPTFSATGPGTPPALAQNIPAILAATTQPITSDFSNRPMRTYPAGADGCGTIPPGTFGSDEIAVLIRGNCNFTVKITNAYNAGAHIVVIGNNQAGGAFGMSIPDLAPAIAADVSAFGIAKEQGDALIAFVNANEPPAPNADLIFADGFDGSAGATAEYHVVGIGDTKGDVLAKFSFRGPTQAQYANLTKPDITGPGVNIYAAMDAADGNYGLDSGTSMSSPHIAGSAALIRAVHPNWSPMEVKSALQTTATLSGFQEDETTQWTVDQVGSGRVDLTKAALAGLTLDESVDNFLAANPSGGTLDMRQLNLASMRDVNCNTSCTWTRTFRNRLNVSGTWTVTAVDPPGYHLTFSPATITVAAGHTQSVSITATATGTVPTTMQFGRVDLTESASHSPVQHLTVAVKGLPPTIQLTPTSLAATLLRNTTTTQTISVANIGGAPLNWSVAAAGNGVVWNQPASVNSGWPSDYSTADQMGAYVAADFVVTSGGPLTKITANGFDNTSPVVAPTSITWRIYGDAGGKPNGNPEDGSGTAPVWTYTAAANSAGVSMASGRDIVIDLAAAGQSVNLTPGTYWFSVAPKYPDPFPSTGTSTAGPWYWFGAAPQGALGMLAGDEYGVSDWTAASTYSPGTTVTDFAFKIEGTIACGAPWLSLSPSSGTNATGTNTPVTATFNATGMNAGVYTATACFGSNDPVTPVATAAVKMTVTIPTYTVTPSAGAHGTISPSTAQTVNEGSTPIFNLTPDTGYHVDTVTGTCGGNLSGSSFTTNPVMADCTVVASFAQDFVGPQCTTSSPVEAMSATDTSATGYATLKGAFDAINAGTHQGGVYIGICGNTSETASAVLNASGAGSASYSLISIKPVGGAARTVSGALDGLPLVDLNGADAVTIDGLNAGGNALTFSNTSVASTAGTSTIRFIEGATGNTVRHATILGSSTGAIGAATGNVLFSTSTIGGGNSNNIIDSDDIGPAGANLPSKGVMSAGDATNLNVGNTVSGSTIHDFFIATNSTAGVNIASNSDNWTISNNKIYQSAARAFTSSAQRYSGIAIGVGTGGTFSITGNVIGFGAADGTGTTTISGSSNEFRGIAIAPSNNLTGTSTIQGNTVSGIVQTSSRASTTASSSAFIGIQTATTSFDGPANILDNTIGSLDGSSSITINANSTTANTAAVVGIFDYSWVDGLSITGNKIGTITLTSGGATGAVTGFRGIYSVANTGDSRTISNNTIGGPAAGSITSTIVGANSVYGIQVTQPNVVAQGNVIRNLAANSTGASLIVVSGMSLTGSTGANTISGNEIHSLSNSSGSASNSIYALRTSFSAVAGNVVERNYVHSLSITSTALTSQLVGILPTAGNGTYQNNMVQLGYDAAGNAITAGYVMYGMFEIAGANNIYNNSIYVGGSGVTASSNTFGFVSNVTSGTRNYVDNIFWNARSNASGTALNIAYLVSTAAGVTSDYNLLYADGTGGAIAAGGSTAYATLADWQTASGLDSHSLSVNPLFVAPTGSASTANLHLQSGSPAKAAGTPLAGVTNDFDGDARSATTPSIGADE